MPFHRTRPLVAAAALAGAAAIGAGLMLVARLGSSRSGISQGNDPAADVPSGHPR